MNGLLLKKNYLCRNSSKGLKYIQIMRKITHIRKGFSKLLKEDKLKAVAECVKNPSEFISLLKSFWHSDEEKQKQIGRAHV